jgi:CheY-like chemotaxis protein
MEFQMKRSALRCLLYVDDEPDIREVVQLSLGLVDGLTIHTANSGQNALELLPVLKPDIVLLDVMMPQIDGPATLMRMRADPAIAGIPVVFMTAKAMPTEVALFKEMGAVAVIAKPFDPMELGNQLVRIWEGIT